MPSSLCAAAPRSTRPRSTQARRASGVSWRSASQRRKAPRSAVWTKISTPSAASVSATARFTARVVARSGPPGRSMSSVSASGKWVRSTASSSAATSSARAAAWAAASSADWGGMGECPGVTPCIWGRGGRWGNGDGGAAPRLPAGGAASRTAAGGRRAHGNRGFAARLIEIAVSGVGIAAGAG